MISKLPQSFIEDFALTISSVLNLEYNTLSFKKFKYFWEISINSKNDDKIYLTNNYVVPTIKDKFIQKKLTLLWRLDLSIYYKDDYSKYNTKEQKQIELELLKLITTNPQYKQIIDFTK